MELVLVHELGHVFGMRHITNTIMDSDWPGAFISEFFSKMVLPQTRIPTLFVKRHNDSETYTSLFQPNGLGQALGIPAEYVKLHLINKPFEDVMLLRGYKKDSLKTETLAELRLKQSFSKSSPVVSLYLDARQQVYTPQIPESGTRRSMQVPTSVLYVVAPSNLSTSKISQLLMQFEPPVMIFSAIDPQGSLDLSIALFTSFELARNEKTSSSARTGESNKQPKLFQNMFHSSMTSHFSCP